MLALLALLTLATQAAPGAPPSPRPPASPAPPASSASARGTNADWPGSLTSISQMGSPTVTLLAQPGSELVALRLSVRIREPSDAISGAAAHQALIRDQLAMAVGRFGGRFELSQEPGHVSYLVTGPASEFDALVSVLRDVVAFTPSYASEVAAAWLRAEQAALARLETADRLVRERLWQQLEGGEPRTAVSGSDRLEAFWTAQLRPSQMRVVVVGGVTAQQVRSAFRDWPVPQRRTAVTAAQGSAQPARPAAGPQLMTPWLGLAYPAPRSDLAVLVVASRILQDALARTELRGASAELWLVDGEPALVIVAAQPPGSGRNSASAVQALSQQLRRLLPAAADGLNAFTVERAAQDARRDMLLASRSPAGMAEVLGRVIDRTGENRAAGRLFANLEQVDAARVAALLRMLGERTPLSAEVRP